MSKDNKQSVKNIIAYGLLLLAISPALFTSIVKITNVRHIAKFEKSFDTELFGPIGHDAVLYRLKPKDPQQIASDLKTKTEFIENSDFYVALDSNNRPLKWQIETNSLSAKVIAEGPNRYAAKLESKSPISKVPATELNELTGIKNLPELVQIEKSSEPLKLEVSSEKMDEVPDNTLKKLWKIQFLPRKYPLEFYSLTGIFFLIGFWALSLKGKFVDQKPVSHTVTLRSLINIPLFLVYWFISVNTLDYLQSTDLMIAIGMIGAGLKCDDGKFFI